MNGSIYVSYVRIQKEWITKGSVFSVNGRLIKQKDGCPMGGSMSGIFADIFMHKLEQDIVVPRNPLFYARYVDDTTDELFVALNNYHPNIKYTIEENPKHFLDTDITRVDGSIHTSVHTKDNKYPVFWTSKVPKRYKRNAINGELHRAFKISSNFDKEVLNIKQKFKNVGFPIRFIDSVIRDFRTNPIDETDDDIIPMWLFDDRKDFVIKLPFCPKNEEVSKQFLIKLNEYTNFKYIFKVIWNTRNIRSLFPLKDRVEHKSCVIYEGSCSCGEIYIGETDRLATIRWSEHDHPKNSTQKSDPAKHIIANPSHQFSWVILTSAPRQYLKRRILESYFIAQKKPKINIQKTPRVLFLFRNGVT